MCVIRASVMYDIILPAWVGEGVSDRYTSCDGAGFQYVYPAGCDVGTGGAGLQFLL